MITVEYIDFFPTQLVCSPNVCSLDVAVCGNQLLTLSKLINFVQIFVHGSLRRTATGRAVSSFLDFIPEETTTLANARLIVKMLIAGILVVHAVNILANLLCQKMRCSTMKFCKKRSDSTQSRDREREEGKREKEREKGKKRKRRRREREKRGDAAREGGILKPFPVPEFAGLWLRFRLHS